LFSASGVHSFKVALGILVKAEHLETVKASDCNLNDSDITLISTISSIAHLDVSQNNFTEAGLEEICKLPKLEELTIDNRKITPSCVNVLKKAKKLKQLVITDLNKQDQLRLARALPCCGVAIGEKRRIYSGTMFNK
jgi:Leucine-rich repeat (LRR) protein